jgi:hypothetical protein
MNHKQATAILAGMLNRHALTRAEKEAVLTAIGVLGWTSLSQSRIKRLKAKRDKHTKRL